MIEPPIERGYTVYSKSGCLLCEKSKQEIRKTTHQLLIINCDEELINDRADFILNMTFYAGREILQFPIIFYDGDFIGGHKQLLLHLEWN
jgi:glutaredoxin